MAEKKVLLDRFRKISTGTLANALDEFGYHANVLKTIKSVSPGFRLFGEAMTVKEKVGDFGTFSSEDFAIGQIIDMAEPGNVIAIDEGGAACSTWGGMATLAAKQKGIQGIVVDGGVRDLEEIIEIDFPVFARYLVPSTGRSRLKVESINTSIVVDGVHVEPGDIIVGDGTGIVSIPAKHMYDIFTLAESFSKDDARAEIDIQNGLSFTEAMTKFSNI